MAEPKSFPALERILNRYAKLLPPATEIVVAEQKLVEQALAELEKARKLLAATFKVRDAFISERGQNFDWNKYFVTLNVAIAACQSGKELTK